MNTLDAILTRQSCRAYKDEQIEKDELTKILIAANAAPIGMATFQCISLTVIQDKALLDKIEANAVASMPPEAPNKHPLYNAPTCILVSVKKEEGPFAAMHPLSASCIMENMLLEATELGLGSTYLMGVAAMLAQNTALCAECKVPDDFTPVAMAAIGYAEAHPEKREGRTDKLATATVM